MLTEIREGSSGWFSWIIAALIIIPMAFWGVQEYASSDATLSVAKIGEQKISQNEFQVRLSNEQQRLRQAMGAQVNEDLLNSDGLKQNVLDQLINRAIVQQVAEKEGYRIGNQQLVKIIKDSELFKVDGEFDEEAYSRYATGSAYSKAQYEDQLRDGSRLSQVTEGYQESALVLSDEVRLLLEIQAEERTVDILTVKKTDFTESVAVTDEEIAEYYAANTQAFMQDEKVATSYVELNKKDLMVGLEVNEDELKALYEQSAESFLSSEKRNTRHILLNISDEKGDDEQKALAEQLVAELRAGADFAELAKAHSADPGSAANGGSLGLVERGQMVPEFEEATFSLEAGKISEPVKSQFGYHIIQVEKIEQSVQKPYEDVRLDLENEERDRIASENILDQVEQLRNLAYEQPDNLDQVVDEMGLELQKTALFDRNTGVGVAALPSFRTAAFSEAVLLDEVNSEPIELSDGQWVVLRKAEHQESEPKLLAAVTEQIKQILVSEKASEAALIAGKSKLEKANLNWDGLAADDGTDIATHTLSLANPQRVVSPTVLEEISNMSLENGQPSVTSVEDTTGDFHIVRLTKVAIGDVAGLSEQIKDSTRRAVAQRNGSALMATYLEGLRKEIAPEINPDLL